MIQCYLVISFIFIAHQSAHAAPKAPKHCELTYLTKSDLSDFRTKGAPISTLGQSINQVLKSSFNFANLVDKYTLGLASAASLGSVVNGNPSFEDIKPNQWNRAIFSGSVIYKDSAFAVIPVRGANIKISFEDKIETLNSGADGKFSTPFFKLVPYTRLRLFPFFILEHRKKMVKTLNVPLQVEVISSICAGKINITQLPLEPITFILSPQSETKP